MGLLFMRRSRYGTSLNACVGECVKAVQGRLQTAKMIFFLLTQQAKLLRKVMMMRTIICGIPNALNMHKKLSRWILPKIFSSL